MIDALARLVLPAPVVAALDVAEEIPEAITAARAEWDAGHGPLAALRAFAARTDGHMDDAVVEEIDRLLRRALEGLDTVCEAGVWLSEREPAIRSGVGSVLAAAFEVAFRAAALRNTLRAWK